MKTRILCIAGLLLAFTAVISAQDYSQLSQIPLSANADYKTAEPKVKEVAAYLLTSPIKTLKTDANRKSAIQFLLAWMQGTPDYGFDIDESIEKLMKVDESILPLYMSAMVKYVLENPDKATDKKEIKYNSFLAILKYCENSANGITLNDDLKKLIEARDKNALKESL